MNAKRDEFICLFLHEEKLKEFYLLLSTFLLNHHTQTHTFNAKQNHDRLIPVATQMQTENRTHY